MKWDFGIVSNPGLGDSCYHGYSQAYAMSPSHFIYFPTKRQTETLSGLEFGIVFWGASVTNLSLCCR